MTCNEYAINCAKRYGKTILGQYENGNHYTVIMNDGTKIKETIDQNDDHFTYDFPENFDIHINNRCNAGCKYCHEGSTKDGEVPSLYKMIFSKYSGEPITKNKTELMKNLTPFYESLRPGTEMAIGGGNIFESDPTEFAIFLEMNELKGIISNITVNQVHVKQNIDKLKEWAKNGLVKGIGLSLVNSKDEEFWKCVDELGENVVIHTIAGILKPEDIEKLEGRKILILGYKHLRRGNDFYSKAIDENIEWLKDNLVNIKDKVKCMSFDCLGIEQLQPKEVLGISDEEWNTLFQGSDVDVLDNKGNITCATMYIDLVGGPKCARMSTAALDKRFDFSFNERIEDVFKKSIQGW